jgi:hypothetical protein
MSRNTTVTKPLSAARARTKDGEGLHLSLNLRELLEDRIRLRTSRSRGLPTRRCAPWRRRCLRTRPSWRTARRSPKGCRSGQRVRCAWVTIPTIKAVYVTDSANTTVKKSVGLRKLS